MNADADRMEQRWRIASLLSAVALLWLATRPYFGAIFDARFYMIEALNALDPARFSEDLYFKFGSQGNFSIFAQLYQPLLPLFGVGTTAIILTVIGQLFWLFGLFCLTRTLAGPRLMWLSIVVVIGLLNVYAGGFAYGETYLTARLYSEAFVMLALAQLAAHPVRAWVLLGLAAALHPLVALPGIAVAFVYLALGRPVWWAVAVAGACVMAVLGLANVAPFSNLFRTLDPEWFAIIDIRSFYCFVGNWPADSFMLAVGAVVWPVAALVLTDGSHRRFLAAALIVGVGGVACTYLGGDIARNVLVVELQPWRSMWLLQIVSRIYIPLVVMTLISRISGTLPHKFAWVTLLTICLILFGSVTRLIRNPESADFTPVSLGILTAALSLMAIQLLLNEQHRRAILIFAIAGFALIPLALTRWDLRSPWIRYVESPEPPQRDLAALLPAKASVYWESGLEMLWFKLRRPSYFSCDQGTGALFYRGTAVHYKHRADSFWPLRVGDFHQSALCAGFDTRPKPERNRTGLQKLCRREPGLDYVVLTQPLDGATAKSWKSPVIFQDMQSSDGNFFARSTDRFYIYSCAPLR